MSNIEDPLVPAPGGALIVLPDIPALAVRIAVLDELPENEQKAQIESVSAAIRQLGDEIGRRYVQIGRILFEGVYGGDESKLGNHGNRGSSLRAVAIKCAEDGRAKAHSETSLRRVLDAYLGRQELQLETDVVAVEGLSLTKLAACHRTTDVKQKAVIVEALKEGDLKTANKTIADAVKSQKVAAAAANASPPPAADSATDPPNDARDEAAEQLAAQERREAAQKAAKILLNQAFAAAVAAGLARVLVENLIEKMLSDAYGDTE